MTLTLSGYAGKKITGLTLSMHSNKSAGSGYMSMTCGDSTLASIASPSSGKQFNHSSWNGAWTQDYVNVSPNVTPKTVGTGESVTITIGATTSSLFCQSFTITYESVATPLSISIAPMSASIALGESASTTVTPENAAGTVTYSASSGGVDLSGCFSDNVFTWTPITPGSHSVTITANDGAMTDTAMFTVTVTASLETPVLSAATNVGDDTFTANWGAVPGATGYKIDVATDSAFTVGSPAATVLTADFSSTTGWTLSGTGTYTGSGYYGAGSPSIKFDDSGDYAISPDFGSGTTLQFWAYGNNGSGSTFAISGLVGGSWTEIETVTIAKGGKTYEVDLPVGTSQLRFDFTKSVNCALDDVVVTRAATAGSMVVDGQSVNGTSYTATGLTTGETYYYRVRAVADEIQSEYSQTASIVVVQNVAPTITCDIGPTIEVAVEDTVEAHLTVTDSNGTPFVTVTPVDFAEYYDNGVFEWTPETEGTYAVTFTAVDADDPSLTSSYTLTIVAEDNAPPAITLSETAVSVQSGETVTVTASATDADGTPALAVASAYSQYFSNGTFTWTPLQSGVYTIEFTATDPVDPTLTSTATLTVTVANVAPVISVSTASASVFVGDNVTATVTVTDTYGTPTVSASDGSLSGTSFTWTPSATGSQTITFTAVDPEDSTLTSTATMTVDVGLATPVLSAATGVSKDSFTINWSAVAGADGYLLDVATNSTDLATLLPYGGKWTLVTDVSELAVGDQVIIAAAAEYNYAAGAQNSNYRDREEIVKSGSELVNPGNAVARFTLGEGTAAGHWTFHDASGYLAAVSGNNNYLHSESEVSDYSSWEVTIIDATTGEATVIAKEGTRNSIRYNSSSPRFSCYEKGQQPVCLYRRIASREVTGTSFTLTGLDPETTYYYCLRAVESTSGIESAPSAIANTTTQSLHKPTAIVIL